jgi:hypothetical protein
MARIFITLYPDLRIDRIRLSVLCTHYQLLPITDYYPLPKVRPIDSPNSHVRRVIILYGSPINRSYRYYDKTLTE